MKARDFLSVQKFEDYQNQWDSLSSKHKYKPEFEFMIKEDFIGWKNLPHTVEIWEKLEAVKTSLEQSLAAGQTLCTTADETHGSTARMVGNIEGLNQLLNISYEDEIEEEIE